MKFASGMITMASGSMGGLTASHNRYGKYFREKVVPVNPNTVRQTSVRNSLATLAIRWKQTLTEAQRSAWNTYAINTPVTDKMGASQTITGLNWYVACNSLRLLAGLAVVDAGPTEFGLAQLSAVSAAVTGSDDTAAVTFSNTDQWATEVGGALLVFGSVGKSPSISYFNGPYRYANKIAGAVSPPTSPQDVVLADNVAEGQRVFLRAIAVQADGRISDPFRFFDDAAA